MIYKVIEINRGTEIEKVLNEQAKQFWIFVSFCYTGVPYGDFRTYIVFKAKENEDV